MPDIIGLLNHPLYEDDNQVPTPSGAYHFYLFAKADGLYLKDASGVVTGPLMVMKPEEPPDHGQLMGLLDDDHPQYHTDERGDARYSQLDHTHAPGDADTLDGQHAAAFSLADHTHPGAGTGDMMKAVYDPNNDGVVENAEWANNSGVAEEASYAPVAGDADTLDGQHAAAFSLSGHTHAAPDHGALTGLGDDDHTQYYNATRHTKAVHDALGIAPGAHSHSLANLTDHTKANHDGLGIIPGAHNQALSTIIGHDKAAHDALGIAPGAHSHSLANLTDHNKANHDGLGIRAGSAATADSTPWATNAGNADTLDGLHASAFLPINPPYMRYKANYDRWWGSSASVWQNVDYETAVWGVNGFGIDRSAGWKCYAYWNCIVQINASLMLNAHTWTANTVAALCVFFNGNQDSIIARWDGGLSAGTSTYAFLHGSCQLAMSPYTYFEIRLLQSSGSSRQMYYWDDRHNWVSAVVLAYY